ncbi:hypothetical protein JCM19039_1797 [Geomicrobium sp. JCM 19039]|nr:hypothetical protein JCM19039_1797 [Geomicrobium sp. JCM 19039]
MSRSALEAYRNGGAWWETEISDIKKNEIIIRGERVEDSSEMYRIRRCCTSYFAVVT